MKPVLPSATRVIHAGKAPRTFAKTVGPPILRGSTILLPDAASLYDDDQITYGRQGLSTQATLSEALAELEGATDVRLYSSGLAALTSAMLAVLKTGDEVLVVDSIYKPTRRFCNRTLKRFGITARYYAPRSAPEAVLAMAGPATRLIVMESPGSLTFEVQDAPTIATLAKAQGILTLMDNTWAAGLLFQPLAHGIDMSAQSLTKYVGGHSDVFMGSVAAADLAIVSALDHDILDFGWSVSPDDAYQMLRGLRTLPTRMARHAASALQVATWLEAQPQIARVHYPALSSSPDHDLWRRYFSGAAGVFSIELRPHPAEAVDRCLNHLRHFGLGFSWGGFESLALSCDEQLAQRTTPPSLKGPLLRLNIGLEDPADLIDDLAQALRTLP